MSHNGVDFRVVTWLNEVYDDDDLLSEEGNEVEYNESEWEPRAFWW